MNIQSHLMLYNRLSQMADVLEAIDKKTDEQKIVMKSLQEMAQEHLRKYRILGDWFVR